jgi:subtilisin family serine protease
VYLALVRNLVFIFLFSSLILFGQERDYAEFAEHGRLLVGYEPGHQKSKVLTELAAEGAEVQGFMEGIDVAVVSVSEKNRLRLWETLGRNRKYRYVEPDYLAEPQVAPSDSQFAYQWHLNAIKAPEAWEITQGSEAVRIAVLDSGLDASHEDLAAKALPGWNIIGGNGDTLDVQGHGTKTAGAAAAATNNGIGVAGVAWANPVVPYVVLNASGSAYYSHIASAIMMAADAGIRIVSISIAGPSSSSTLANAIAYAWNKGTVVFAAAGNYGTNAPYYPAATPYAVAVGATDATDAKASYSNYGSWVTLFAPGHSILTTLNGGGYGYASGTSYAAPIAAGVAALVLSKNPSLTAAQLVDILRNTTDDLGDPGFDSTFSWGRINAWKAVNGAGNAPPSDRTPPAVSISSPAAGATVSGNVLVTVAASDNLAVTKVELWAGSTLLGSRAEAPYYFTWNTTGFSGAVTLTAKAFDAAGNTGTGTLTVTVKPPPDTVNPVATITSPAAGSTVDGTVTVGVTASDNVGVTKVELWSGASLAGVSTAAPYSFSWNTSGFSGTVTLTAKAFDAAGNMGTASISVNIAPPPPPEDKTPPSVAFTSPAAGSTISAATVVSAAATDDVAVTRVDFYAGASLAATDTAAPYEFTLNPATYANGALTLTARAYDAKSNVGQTAMSVNILNTSGNRNSGSSSASIVSPVSGAVVGGTVTIQASVTMNSPVTRVEFYVGNVIVGSRTAAPYSLAWNSVLSGDGAKMLYVKAYGATGQIITSNAVNVTVSNAPAADVIAPTVSFISPQNHQTVSGSMSVQVAAADNMGVTRVELYSQGRLAATRTAAPYTFTLYLRPGLSGVVLTAKAYDAAGNSSSASITINTE